VYACTNNRQANTVSIRKLLYIGEAENIRSRVSGHERWKDWEQKLQSGEELCFNAAIISPAADRERAEAAMINRHKPPCNVEYVNSFPFEQTSVWTKGRNAKLEASFTVYPVRPQGLGSTLLGGGKRW